MWSTLLASTLTGENIAVDVTSMTKLDYWHTGAEQVRDIKRLFFCMFTFRKQTVVEGKQLKTSGTLLTPHKTATITIEI